MENATDPIILARDLIDTATRSLSSQTSGAPREWAHKLFALCAARTLAPAGPAEEAVALARASLDPLLPKLLDDIELLILRMESSNVLEIGSDFVWHRVCVDRSSIAFFMEIFGPCEVVRGATYMVGELERLDQAMRIMGWYAGRVPAVQVPSGVPPTHWWWWYPGESDRAPT